MRWIFASLVLLNLLYFAWNYWQSQVMPAPKTQVSSGLPPEVGDDLVLLTERLPAPSSPAPPPSIAPMAPPSGKEATREICARMGPYADQESAGAVVRTLADSALVASVSEAVDQHSRQYWVILPPAQSRQKALQLLRELQARNIDSYLITEGEMVNAISLGLFNREALAAGVRDKIREAGYKAEIHHKQRHEKAYWVQVSFDQASEKARKVLGEVVSEEDGIKISNTPCETFAQPN